MLTKTTPSLWLGTEDCLTPMVEEELSGPRSSSRPTKRSVVPEVMLPNSLCWTPPEFDEGKGWDAGWERVVAAAEAQRDESGRKMQMTVRTLKGMPGSGEIYGRSEKIAIWPYVIVCLTSATRSKISYEVLPGTMKVWIPMMKMTCMGPKLRSPSFLLSIKANASLPTKTEQNQQTLIEVVIFDALCSQSRSVT